MSDALNDQRQGPHEPRASRLRGWQVVVLTLAFLLLYLVLALIPGMPEQFYGSRPWYMPAGLSIALLVFFGLRFVPAVFVGAFVTALFVLRQPGVAALDAAVVTVGYSSASAALRYGFRIHRHFRSQRDLFYFVGVSLIAPLFVGAINVALLVAFGRIPQEAYGPSTLKWWIADSVGIMTVAPFLLTVVFPRLQRWLAGDASPANRPTPAQRQRVSLWEQALWMVGVVFILWVSFNSPFAHDYHLFYFGFIPLLWMTLRCGLPGASTAVLLLNIGTVLCLRNAGVIFYSVTDIQLFMLVLSLTGLLLGVTVSLRQRAEETMAHEQRRLQTVLQTLPIGVIITDASGRILDVNAQFYAIWGDSAPRVATIKEYSAYKGWWVDSGKPLAAHDWALVRALQQGETITAELVDIQRFDGARAVILLGAAPIRESGGTLIGAVAVMQDVTEQRLLASQIAAVNRALTVLSGANEILIRATDETSLLQDVCGLIVAKGNYCFAWVGFAEHDAGKTVHPVARAGYEGGYLDTVQISWAETERGLGPTGTAIRTGQPAVAQNIPTDPTYAPWREEAVTRGYASSIALPLHDNHGNTFGSLTIFSPKADAFDTAEVTLLHELADDLSYGMIALRTREAREQAEEELETIFAAAPMMIIYKDTNGQLLRVNRAYAEAAGRSEEELVRLPTAQLYPRGDLDKYEQDDREVYTSGQPKLGIIEELETAQGRRLIRTDKVPYRGKDGRILGVIAFVLDITEQKRAEEELEQERALLSSAIELLPFPIFFVNYEGIIFRANQATQSFFGEQLCKNWWDIELLEPDTKVPIQQANRPAKKALLGTTLRGLEALLRLKHGREIPVLIHAAPIYIG
ncbi:MAG TPA: PAS domain S-box protein, partial [Armatimonadota bacterium]